MNGSEKGERQQFRSEKQRAVGKIQVNHMRRKHLILCLLVAGVLFDSGCAYFRPSQTEAARLREQQTVRENEYLKGSLLDGLIQAGGTALMEVR